MAPYTVGAPSERVAIEVMGPLPTSDAGKKYLLLFVAYFTKWPEAFPLESQEAPTVAEVLVKEYVCRFRVPLLLHFDQGWNFKSKVFAEMYKLLRMKKT